jgi:hypothetical protein
MKSAKTFLEALIVAALIAFAGCSTVTPKVIEPEAIAFHGNHQDAGVIRIYPDHSALIDATLRQKYNDLIAVYGKTFSPVLVADAGLQPCGIYQDRGDTWRIDAEHLALLIHMNLLKRSGITAPK